MPTALPVSAPVDTFMQSADLAAMQANIGMTAAGIDMITAADATAQAALLGVLTGSTGGAGAADSSKAALYDISGGLLATDLSQVIASNLADLQAGLADGLGGVSIGTVSGLFFKQYISSSEITGSLTPLTAGLTGNRSWQLPDVSGTLITNNDTGTVTSAMLAGSIANAKLANSAITIGGTSVSLGGTITALTSLTNLGVSMASNTAMTGFALGSITDTTSRPFSITQTLNNSSLTATVLKLAATVTAAAAASKIIDICGGSAGATSLFSVGTDGNVVISPAATGDQKISLAKTTSGFVPTWLTLYSANAFGFGFGTTDFLRIYHNGLVWLNQPGGRYG